MTLLISPTSTSTKRKFTVGAKPVMLRAFNLAVGEVVKFNSILVESGSMPHTDGCFKPFDIPEASVLATLPLTGDCAYKLTAGAPFGVFAVAGNYEVEIPPSALGVALIEVVELADIESVPNTLVFGDAANCCGCGSTTVVPPDATFCAQFQTALTTAGAPSAPLVTDEILVNRGGSCVRVPLALTLTDVKVASIIPSQYNPVTGVMSFLVTQTDGSTFPVSYTVGPFTTSGSSQYAMTQGGVAVPTVTVGNLTTFALPSATSLCPPVGVAAVALCPGAAMTIIDPLDCTKTKAVTLPQNSKIVVDTAPATATLDLAVACATAGVATPAVITPLMRYKDPTNHSKTATYGTPHANVQSPIVNTVTGAKLIVQVVWGLEAWQKTAGLLYGAGSLAGLLPLGSAVLSAPTLLYAGIYAIGQDGYAATDLISGNPNQRVAYYLYDVTAGGTIGFETTFPNRNNNDTNNAVAFNVVQVENALSVSYLGGAQGNGNKSDGAFPNLGPTVPSYATPDKSLTFIASSGSNYVDQGLQPTQPGPIYNLATPAGGYNTAVPFNGSIISAWSSTEFYMATGVYKNDVAAVNNLAVASSQNLYVAGGNTQVNQNTNVDVRTMTYTLAPASGGNNGESVVYTDSAQLCNTTSCDLKVDTVVAGGQINLNLGSATGLTVELLVDGVVVGSNYANIAKGVINIPGYTNIGATPLVPGACIAKTVSVKIKCQGYTFTAGDTASIKQPKLTVVAA
jgi:hypothetical protein